MIRAQKAPRRRGRTPSLETLEDRRLPATGIVSLIQFAAGSTRTVAESAGRLTFTVERTGDLSAAATVDVKTFAGTALEGYDYAPYRGTLTFAAGQSTATFVVTIVNDKVAEAQYKAFVVTLSNPSEGTGLAGRSSADVYILDDEPASALPISFIDYGPYGVWSYDAVSGFGRVTSDDPQQVVGSTNRNAYMDLGPNGLWTWDAVRGLRKLSAADPQQIVVINDAWTRAEDVVLADFGADGLWRYSESQGWRMITTGDARAIVLDDQTAYIDFGPGGLWRWSDQTPWLKLSDAGPEGMAADAGVLFVDRGAGGTWRWTSAAGWRQIGTGDPQAVASVGDKLFADYGAAGLWTWTAAAGWTLFNKADVRSMVAVDGVLYLEYGSFGLWTWSDAQGMKKQTGSAVESLIASPGAMRVLVDQGSAGLWAWTSAGYSRINAADPDSTGRTA
ncbi:MAG: hypothetical protein BGO49_03925 [Planctomycetales bacterium 71-10]|nr:MAG: hypothetical protein BGO49_03925 [Planctomycetales bacterium 71-10]